MSPALSAGLRAIATAGLLALGVGCPAQAGSITPDVQQAVLQSNLLFSNSLLACDQREGALRFIAQGKCGWMRLRQWRLDRSGDAASDGFADDVSELAGGGQFQVGERWHLGAVLSYEKHDLEQDGSMANADGSLLQAALVAERQFGALQLLLSLVGGTGDFNSSQPVPESGVAEGSYELGLLAVRAGVAYTWAWQSWYLQPRGGFAGQYLHRDAYVVEGEGGSALAVDAQDDSFTYLELGLSVGGEIAFPGGMLMRPDLLIGYTRYLSDTVPEVNGELVGGEGQAVPFSSQSELDRDYANVALGLDLLSPGNMVFRVSGSGQFGAHTRGYGGAIRLSLPF